MPLINENNLARLPIGTPAIGGDKTGYFENRDAASNATDRIDRSDSRLKVQEEVFNLITKEIEKTTGDKLPNPYKDFSPDFGLGIKTMEDVNSETEQRKKAIYEYVNSNQGLFPNLQNLDDDAIDEKSKQIVNFYLSKQQDIAERQTALGAVGEFVGGLKSFATDPINLLAVGVDIAFTKGAATSAIRSTSSIIAKTALREAAISAGSEALIQTEVSDWYKTLDLPYDINTFIANVSMAGIGGAVIGGGIAGIGPAVDLTKKQLIKGAEAINKAKAKINKVEYVPDPELEAIKLSDQFDDVINAQNIIPDDVGDLQHTQTINQAIDAIDTGDYSKIISKEDVESTKSTIVADETLENFDDVNSVGFKEEFDIALKEIEDEIELRGDDFLNEQIPVEVFDRNLNENVTTNLTVKEFYEEIQADKSMITRMKDCLL
jgi:hypothetical protein